MKTLNPQQQAAVCCDDPRILCMAGPGSGKTTVVIERVLRLIRDGIPPELMVVVTFTNEAADELKRRAAKALEVERVTFGYCGTLHGLMLRLLEQFGERIGLSRHIIVLGDDGRKALLEEVIAEVGYNGTKKALAAALAAGPWELPAAGNKVEVCAKAFYQRLLRDSMLDFDSILVFGLRLLTHGGITAHDIKCLHLIVDEFQDSSPLDAVIYDRLPVLNRFFCGDIKQSIYNFRGADVTIIQAEALTQGTTVLPLEDNYRCAVSICEVAQRLIDCNGGIRTITRSAGGFHGIVTADAYDDAFEEIGAVSDLIRQCPDPSEVAVIVRSNALVDFFRDNLKGCRVKRERPRPNPKDWAKATQFLSLLCNPDSMTLGYNWLRGKEGKRAAEKVKLEAMKAGVSINFICWNYERPAPEKALNLLAREGIGRESLSRLETTLAVLGADATLPELVAATNYEGDREVAEPGVSVMTVHASKGREFDNVFLPAFEQGVMPNLSKTCTIEEERRIAFVAMTRARHRLHISWSAQREYPYPPYDMRPAVPSQFVVEAGF